MDLAIKETGMTRRSSPINSFLPLKNTNILQSATRILDLNCKPVPRMINHRREHLMQKGKRSQGTAPAALEDI